jgi:hypothetical protein
MAVSNQLHAPATSSPGKNPGAQSTERWVGPTVGLDGFREVKISFSRRDSKPQTEQTADSRYIDCFFKRYTAQTVYTVCTRINYKIVPVTNLYKYFHYGTSVTE